MNELVIFNEVTAIIAKAKAENEKLVFVYTDPDGEKAARSHISNLRKVKTKISDVHKDAKAEALTLSRKLDSKKRELIGEVDSMIAVHKDPIDAIEAEKQAVIDAETKRLEEAEEKRLLELEAREAAVKAEEEKQAAEKVEAERLEREKRIAEEAGERAKAKAELDAKNAAAIRETIERVRKEKEEAKEQKRIANKKHREKIEGSIQAILGELGLNEDEVGRVLKALKCGGIPHVSINY
jgi:hypothetical protein